MSETEWIRIPREIPSDADRRALCSILCANGLETRIVRVRETLRGTPKRFVEFRTGPEIFTPFGVKISGCPASETP